MAAHGCVRATGDIDIFVKPTPENSVAVFESLVAFGAPLSGITEEDFAVPGTVYQIGVSRVPNSSLKEDVIYG